MKNNRFMTFLKNPKVILVSILIVFFFKGVFLVAIQPIFGGQDEARHYDTVQYLAEPIGAVSSSEKRKNDAIRNKDDLNTYSFSDEIKKTSEATDTDILRGDIYNTIAFSDSSSGINEPAIDAKTWKPYNYYTEPEIAGKTSLYHKVAAQIETLLSDQTILVRFYLLRIFSVLLGTLAVLFAYLTARTIGFSTRVSLIVTALLSFQPKFSLYFTNINYDVLLIPMFFLFTYAGARTLKSGLNWKNLALLILAMTVATQTKATGYILVVVFMALIAYVLYEKVRTRSQNFRSTVFGGTLLVVLLAIVTLYNHFLAGGTSLGQALGSIPGYLQKTITFGKFILPSGTYWGTLSWTRSFVVDNATNIIFVIESIALIGLAMLLFSKKFTRAYPAFLPAKKYLFFLIGMIVALELGVRTADWSTFSRFGGMKLSLGTPGRYFLPNLSAHILLVATGLGAVLAHFKKEKYFETTLLAGLILMFALTTYLTFNAIILRFYF